MSKFIKNLFHQCKKPNMVQIGYVMEEDRYERYTMRQYRCKECGNTKWVDGRYDPYC